MFKFNSYVNRDSKGLYLMFIPENVAVQFNKNDSVKVIISGTEEDIESEIRKSVVKEFKKKAAMAILNLMDQRDTQDRNQRMLQQDLEAKNAQIKTLRKAGDDLYRQALRIFSTSGKLRTIAKEIDKLEPILDAWPLEDISDYDEQQEKIIELENNFKSLEISYEESMEEIGRLEDELLKVDRLRGDAIADAEEAKAVLAKKFVECKTLRQENVKLKSKIAALAQAKEQYRILQQCEGYKSCTS